MFIFSCHFSFRRFFFNFSTILYTHTHTQRTYRRSLSSSDSSGLTADQKGTVLDVSLFFSLMLSSPQSILRTHKAHLDCLCVFVSWKQFFFMNCEKESYRYLCATCVVVPSERSKSEKCPFQISSAICCLFLFLTHSMLRNGMIHTHTRTCIT